MAPVQAAALFNGLCTKVESPDGNLENILGLTIELRDLGEIQAIDVTVVDRIVASQHYAKRTNYTFRAVKTTILVDCSAGVRASDDAVWSLARLCNCDFTVTSFGTYDLSGPQLLYQTVSKGGFY